MPSLSAGPREMDIVPVMQDGPDARDDDGLSGSVPAPGRTEAGNPAPQPALTRPQRGGMRRMERTLTAVMIVLMLLIPAVIIITESRDRKGGGPAPDDNDHGHGAGWPIYMSVDGKRALSGQRLTIQGDIVVKRGAELSIADCDLTMNGTFIVYGKLSICNTRLQDFTPVVGLHYGGRDGNNLSLPADLSDCRSAALNIKGMAGYPMLARMQAYFITNGVTTPGPLLEFDDTVGFQNVSVDLTAFCGNNITVMLGPLQGLFTQFSLYGLELVTDKGTAPYDLAAARLGEDWSYYDFRFPFCIDVARGGLTLDRATLTQFDDDKELIHASEARVRIAGSTLQLEPGLHIQSHGGRYLISGFNASLDISGSSLLNNSGIELTNSVISINDSTFFNQSEAIIVRDSDLRIDRCRFDNCDVGIEASRDVLNRGKGIFRMNGTVMDNQQTGIKLNNISASIENSTIAGGSAPLTVYLSNDLSRGNCTFDNALNMRNNAIWTGESNQHAPAIDIYSSIPVTGVEGLLRNNRINSSICLERHLMINCPSNDQLGPSRLYYNDSGTERIFDSRMDPAGGGAYSEGWRVANDQSWGHWNSGFMLNSYTNEITMEVIQSNGTSCTMRSLSEDLLSFRLVSDGGIGYGTFDAGGLKHPPDALQVNITLRNVCDLQLFGLQPWHFDPWPYTHNLSLTYYVLNQGMEVSDFQVTCTIGGVRIIRIEKLEGHTYQLDIDMRRIRESGELVLTVMPIGAEEEDISNNVARINITLVGASAEYTGPVDLSGVWVLAENADLTFRGCSLAAGWSMVTGRGHNRIDIINSTLNVSSLSLDAENGSIQNSDINSPWDILIFQGGNSQMSLFGAGNWSIDNVSCGYRARELHQLPASEREAFIEGILNEPEYRYYYNPSQFSASAGNLSVTNSTFFVQGTVYLWAGWNATVANTTMLWCAGADVSAENLTISGSKFSGLENSYIKGANASIEVNIFSNNTGSVFLSGTGRNSTFRQNRMENVGPLILEGTELPRVENNTFTSMTIAIVLRSSGNTSALLPFNHFADIGRCCIAVQKSIAFEVFRGIAGNGSDISDVRVHLDDLISGQTEFTTPAASSIDQNVTVSRTNAFQVTVRAIYSNGTERSLSTLPVSIYLFFSNGPTQIVERTIKIRDSFYWNELIG